MSLIAAIVDWQVAALPIDPVGRLLSALPDRTPDGRRYVRLPHALLGFGARFVRQVERNAVQPLWDERRKLAVVGDVRLDNRDELRGELAADDAGDLGTDLLVLAAAYARWGRQMVERLVGDFAFVIWDGRRREVFAARDPFGVRSLVYHRKAGRLILATEPAQLLALPEVDRSPNPQAVVDFLSWSYSHYGPTFFRDIFSVRPGCHIVVDASSLRETNYFQPPAEMVRHARVEDYREQFSSLFQRAVRDRLDSEYPLVAHLSGGLDSSSIVCAAGRVYSTENQARAPLHIASAVFPGQSHDESPFIQEVLRSVKFEAHYWDGNQPSKREFSQPSLSIPGGSVAFNGGSTGDIEIAASLGARVILSGDPGDFVTGELGLFNDLVARMKWLTIVRQISSAGSANERSVRMRLVKRAVREEAHPALLAVWRALRGRSTRTETPNWLQPHLESLWTRPEERNPPDQHVGVNRLQQRAWDVLRWSRTGWMVDLMGVYTASAGTEVRFPLLDARLVRFILAVPPEYRLLGASRRTLHREAMIGIVPEPIARRMSKPSFNTAVVRWGHSCLPWIREILEDHEWRSEAFVDRGRARSLLKDLASRPIDRNDRREWLGVRAMVHLETWLRAVFRYAAPQEILTMSETPTSIESKEGIGATPISREPYSPPTLTIVGNVRQLLAAGTVSGDDTVNPAPSQD